MKEKTLAIFILILACGLSIKSIGLYNGDYLLISDNAVLKMPPELSDPVIIDNQFSAYIAPQITLNGNTITVTPSIKQSFFSIEKSKYTLSSKSEKSNVEITENIEIENTYLKNTVTLKNTGKSTVNADISFRVSGEDSVFYFPSVVDKAYSDYFVVMDRSLNGNALAVISTETMGVQDSAIQNITSYYFGKRGIILKEDQSITMSATYYPLSVRQKNMTLASADPFTKTIGQYNATEATTIKGILAALSAENKKANGTFNAFYTVDFSAEKDSLGIAAEFRKICQTSGMECKLKIGVKNSAYYAWISANEKGWKDVDPFDNSIKTPSGYSLVYEEPGKTVVTYGSNATLDLARGTAFVIDTGKSHLMLYIVLLLIAAVVIMYVFQFRASKITRLFQKKITSIMPKEETNGQYEVLTKDSVDDNLVNEVLENIRTKGGEVDVQKLSEEMRYSPELVSFAVNYLKDIHAITRKGGVTPTEAAAFMEEQNKKKMPDKKIIIAAVVVVSAVAILILFLAQ